MKVLVGEDDESIATVVTMILEENGHTVIHAPDEKSFHKNLSQEPHLILLDISLNGANGASLAKKMKKDQKYSHIPIIMVSANRDTKDIAEKAGADGFLLKPFDLDQLLDVVAAHTS